MVYLLQIHENVKGKQRIAPPHTVSMSDELDHSHIRRSRSPIVKGYANPCQEECLFEDDNNRWCLSTARPMLTAGWDVVQSSDSSTYWTIQLQPYIET